MDILETLSLLASIASLVLAIVAIWLSVVFFKLSSKLAESTTEAAKGIGASVERLENLFDKLYSDTFSMMRDTVSDMRKHIWPQEESGSDQLAEEAERKADAKIEELKKNVFSEIASVLQRQRVADQNLQSFRDEMIPLIDRVISSSRLVDAEAREETLRAAILRIVRMHHRKKRRVLAEDLMSKLFSEDPMRVVEELESMENEGLISFSTKYLGPDTVIRLRPLAEVAKGAESQAPPD